MKKYLFGFLLVFSNYAFSYHFCEGTVSHVWVTSGGSVHIVGSWRGGHTMICLVNGEWKGVGVEACKSWLTLATAAQMKGSKVIVRYDDEDTESCSTIPTYGASPAPDYVMLN